jgi:hypothetical protein
VVDTTNFTDEYAFRGFDQNLHLRERFTRVAPDALLYEFTVDNPTAFTKPWTAQISVSRTKGPIFEYASRRQLRNDGYPGWRGQRKKAITRRLWMVWSRRRFR